MPGTPHQAWPHLRSCTLGTHCHPRANGFPSCHLMHDSVRSLFCTEVTVKKRLQESSWQPPNLEKLLSALSSSTRSFHFLLTGTHPPSPAPVYSASSLPRQHWHFSGSGCWFGSTGHPAGARKLTHRLGAGVSAHCLPSSCRFQCHYGAFSTWWGVGKPLIRSTFKLLLQPFSSPVEMPIPCPSHRDDAHGAAGTGEPGNEEPHAVPSTRPTCAPALCNTAAPILLLLCLGGVPGVWGARVMLSSTLGLDAMSKSLWRCTGPCCGVSCFS